MIELDLDKIYRDQSPYKCQYANRHIFSTFLPHGIKSIDSEYGERIRNIHNKVELKYRYRSYEIKINSKGQEYESLNMITTFRDKNYGYGYRLRYNNDAIGREYFYTNPPIINSEGKEDPESLRKEIIENTHLHDIIIENLISNLDSILKKY